MTTKRTITIYAPILLVAAGSFVLGIWFKGMESAAQRKLAHFQKEGIQKAADNLLAAYPEDFDSLGKLSNDMEVSKAVTSALLGANQQLNSSNVVFLAVDQSMVENGLLHDPFWTPFNYRLVLERDKNATNSLKKRILVVTEE